MTRTIPHFQFESEFTKQGYKLIAGMDEAGRGAWAGPVVTAAVIAATSQSQGSGFKAPNWDGVKDSKQLSPKRRETLDKLIKRTAINYAIGIASVEEIDELGIHKATFLAFKRAVSNLRKADFLLIDGFRWPESPLPQHHIIKGDTICMSIAAASILAKVERDRLMRQLHETCPNYAFGQHKGYGTELHQKALAKHGVSKHHRKSFKPCSQAVDY